jgi:hypothetical protein
VKASNAVSAYAVRAALGEALKGAPDELAFLALTSKIELPVRDRLAYRLLERMRPTDRIAREYKRSDIACLQGSGQPCAIIELKACYSVDLVENADVWADFVKRDLEKAARLAKHSDANGCACIGVLLITHPRGVVTRDYKDTIKYTALINRAIDGPRRSPKVVRAMAEERIRPLLAKIGTTLPFKQSLGRYLGVGVDLFGYVVAKRRG